MKTFSLLMLATNTVLAASGGHGSDGIPGWSIFWQAFNLSIVIAIIYFSAGKSAVAFFKQRRDGFVASAKKAEEAKAEAEKQYLEIKNKIDHLKANYDESLSRAHAESADLKKQLVSDGQEQARRIRDEAQVTVKIESQRAQRDLHEKFVRDTISMARQVLSKDIGSADHQKLQTDFTKNIEAVSP